LGEIKNPLCLDSVALANLLSSGIGGATTPSTRYCCDDPLNLGRISRLLEEEDRSLNLPGNPHDGAYERARIAVALGEREQAMELLRQSRFNKFNLVHLDLAFEPVWDYPPFQELLRPKG